MITKLKIGAIYDCTDNGNTARVRILSYSNDSEYIVNILNHNKHPELYLPYMRYRFNVSHSVCTIITTDETRDIYDELEKCLYGS